MLDDSLKEESHIWHVIGGDKPGFVVGTFQDAKFNSPQGVVFHHPTLLYVADTENHAVRELQVWNTQCEAVTKANINLQSLRVITLVGRGVEGLDLVSGAQFRELVISSPWDLCLVSSTVISGA
ncbi:NHL repeat-containing protein 2-like [Zootermopsis nevadensis]|uniref:NHL repeat-containing protein 2-like n=1 Tax=Zootermopsis nevadensis TaxID=136037 RepID=UPI000B8EB098|nr:NHL repeat-containing protein 2-like [Zootermopsis nevadensis]